MKMRKHLTLLIVGLLFLGISSVALAESKVATVDVDKLFDQYQKTVALNEKMEADIQVKQAERDKLVEEIRRLKDELVLLAESNKLEKQQEIDRKIQDLQAFDEKTRQELGEKRNNFMREILVELDGKIREYGKENDFDYILNSKMLLYGKDQYDVTEELLKKFNSN